MRKILFFLILALVSFGLCDVWVNGYTKSDGTYVPGHYRSDPDGDKSNNWTTKGNANPYTGEAGTKVCTTQWIDGYTDSNGKYHYGHMGTVCN